MAVWTGRPVRLPAEWTSLVESTPALEQVKADHNRGCRPGARLVSLIDVLQFLVRQRVIEYQLVVWHQAADGQTVGQHLPLREPRFLRETIPKLLAGPTPISLLIRLSPSLAATAETEVRVPGTATAIPSGERAANAPEPAIAPAAAAPRQEAREQRDAALVQFFQEHSDLRTAKLGQVLNRIAQVNPESTHPLRELLALKPTAQYDCIRRARQQLKAP